MSIYLGTNLLSSSSIDSSNIIGTINTSTESIVINHSHLPDISITDVEVFASIALRNASTNTWHKGDIAVITGDPVSSYIFVGTDGDNNGTVDGDWQILNTPSAIPVATQSIIGGVKIGYTENDKNYPLELDSDMEAFVNVPWENTTYGAATTTIPGLIELEDDAVQTVAANAVSTTASRSYGLQVNSDGQGVVNVPWTDTVITNNTGSTHIPYWDGDSFESSTIEQLNSTNVRITGGLRVNTGTTDGVDNDITFQLLDGDQGSFRVLDLNGASMFTVSDGPSGGSPTASLGSSGANYDMQTTIHGPLTVGTAAKNRNLTVTGATTLNTGLTGYLRADAGVVSMAADPSGGVSGTAGFIPVFDASETDGVGNSLISQDQVAIDRTLSATPTTNGTQINLSFNAGTLVPENSTVTSNSITLTVFGDISADATSVSLFANSAADAATFVSGLILASPLTFLQPVEIEMGATVNIGPIQFDTQGNITGTNFNGIDLITETQNGDGTTNSIGINNGGISLSTNGQFDSMNLNAGNRSPIRLTTSATGTDDGGDLTLTTTAVNGQAGNIVIQSTETGSGVAGSINLTAPATTVTGDLTVTGDTTLNTGLTGTLRADAGVVSIDTGGVSVNSGNNTVPVSNADSSAFVDSPITVAAGSTTFEPTTTSLSGTLSVTAHPSGFDFSTFIDGTNVSIDGAGDFSASFTNGDRIRFSDGTNSVDVLFDSGLNDALIIDQIPGVDYSSAPTFASGASVTVTLLAEGVGTSVTTVTGDLTVTGAINGSITSGGFTSFGDAPANTINSVANVTFGYRSESGNGNAEGAIWIQLPSGTTTTGITDNYKVATIGGTEFNIGTTNFGIRLDGVDYLIPFSTDDDNRFGVIGTDNHVGPFNTTNGATTGDIVVRFQNLQSRVPSLRTALDALTAAGTALPNNTSHPINLYTESSSVGTLTAHVQIDGSVDIIGNTVQQGTFVIDTGVVDVGIGATNFDVVVNATSNSLSRINGFQINTAGATLSSTTGSLILETGTDGHGDAHGISLNSAGNIQLTTNANLAGGSITAHGTIEGGLNGNESPLLYMEAQNGVDSGGAAAANGTTAGAQKFRITDNSDDVGLPGYITFIHE